MACSERPVYGAEGLASFLSMVFFLYNIEEQCLWPFKNIPIWAEVFRRNVHGRSRMLSHQAICREKFMGQKKKSVLP